MVIDVEKHKKHRIALRYWLSGRNYTRALKAFEFAYTTHTGTRKDNVTPEFHHQVQITLYLRAFESSMLYPEDTFCASLLHDVVEDYDVPLSEIEKIYGSRVASATRRLSKVVNGEKREPKHYFGEIGECPIASIVKPADRISNQQSMSGVFTIEKQKEYIDETQDYIIPLVKKARHSFCEQECIYESLKFTLESQIELLQIIHKDKK